MPAYEEIGQMNKDQGRSDETVDLHGKVQVPFHENTSSERIVKSF